MMGCVLTVERRYGKTPAACVYLIIALFAAAATSISHSSTGERNSIIPYFSVLRSLLGLFSHLKGRTARQRVESPLIAEQLSNQTTSADDDDAEEILTPISHSKPIVYIISFKTAFGDERPSAVCFARFKNQE